MSSSIVWKPLVVCPHSETARRVRSSLMELGTAEVTMAGEYPRMGAILPLAAKHAANLCFIDVASNQDHALLLVGEAAAALPGVAMNPRNDADLILRCLRKGACEFLSDPGVEPVHEVLERLARARAPLSQRRTGAVYCVVPGKPGSGASTLAAHLAIRMHAAGAARILLADADPLTGSVAFMLKLKSEFHFDEVLRDWKRMDEDLWARLTVPCCGIDVVLAPEGLATHLELNRQLAAELLGFWRERYDAVVLDVPDLRAAIESGFAALADQVLLVTTNELAALHATRRAIEFLDQTISQRGRLHLIVNRYAPATGLKREDLKTALHLEPFAVLSNDYESIQSALLDGKPVGSGSRFGSSIQALAEQLEAHAGREKKDVPVKKNRSWFGRR